MRYIKLSLEECALPFQNDNKDLIKMCFYIAKGVVLGVFKILKTG